VLKQIKSSPFVREGLLAEQESQQLPLFQSDHPNNPNSNLNITGAAPLQALPLANAHASEHSETILDQHFLSRSLAASPHPSCSPACSGSESGDASSARSIFRSPVGLLALLPISPTLVRKRAEEAARIEKAKEAELQKIAHLLNSPPSAFGSQPSTVNSTNTSSNGSERLVDD
jgi:hypothetical protein